MAKAKAKGRMIARSISTSRKLSKVSDSEALLFTWIIPHTDEYGRIEGEASMILGTIVPLRKYSVEDVEKMLVSLEKINLIIRYTVNEDMFLEVVKFEDSQVFRSDRPRKSDCPPPDTQTVTKPHPPDTKQETSSRLSKVKLSKVKLSKVKLEKEAYGEFKNVFLMREEYERLVDVWLGGNESLLNELIFELGTYMKSKGKSYKDHYATILNWAKRKHGEAKIQKNSRAKEIIGL